MFCLDLMDENNYLLQIVKLKKNQEFLSTVFEKILFRMQCCH